MSATEDGEGAPVSAWRLLRRGPFARYVAGNFLSNVGNWFQDIAAAILIFQLTGSATFVAGVAVASYGTSLVLSPWGGKLADQFDRRRLLIITHVGQTIAAAALSLLALFGRADAWTIFVFMIVIGVGRAINNPTLHALLPALVSLRDLAPATALQSVTFNLARAVGPVLGAFIIAIYGASIAFALNALSFAVFTVLLLTIKVPPRVIPASEMNGGVIEGFRYAAARPKLLLLLAAATVVGTATDPVLTLGPSFSEQFGQDESWAGWLVSAFGGGAVLAAPFAHRLREALGRVRTAAVALVVVAGGLVVMGLSPGPELALAGALLAGAAFMTGSTDVTTGLQELTDDAVRGRVMALWSMGFLGSRPLAALLNGTVADAWSPSGAVLVLAAIMLVFGAIVYLSYRRLGGASGFLPVWNT